jgi:hypothetical protein
LIDLTFFNSTAKEFAKNSNGFSSLSALLFSLFLEIIKLSTIPIFFKK